MTVRDRILAACCGDEEQADLVGDLLARRTREPFGADGDARAGASSPSPAGSPREQVEPCCPSPNIDTDGYCSTCSALNGVRP